MQNIYVVQNNKLIFSRNYYTLILHIKFQVVGQKEICEWTKSSQRAGAVNEYRCQCDQREKRVSVASELLNVSFSSEVGLTFQFYLMGS